jgi:hypothetical protein
LTKGLRHRVAPELAYVVGPLEVGRAEGRGSGYRDERRALAEKVDGARRRLMLDCLHPNPTPQ